MHTTIQNTTCSKQYKRLYKEAMQCLDYIMSSLMLLYSDHCVNLFNWFRFPGHQRILPLSSYVHKPKTITYCGMKSLNSPSLAQQSCYPRSSSVSADLSCARTTHHINGQNVCVEVHMTCCAFAESLMSPL